jgi:PAS domain S-box-containing protein
MAYSLSDGIVLRRSFLVVIAFLCIYGICMVLGAGEEAFEHPFTTGMLRLTAAGSPPAYVEMPVPVAYTITAAAAVLMLVTLVLVITDTRRQQVEVALREGEERFRTIFDESPIGIQVYDTQGRLRMINPAAREIFGISGDSGFGQIRLFDDPNVPAEEMRRLHDDQAVRCIIPYSFDEVRARALYATGRTGTIYLYLLATPIHTGKPACPVGYLLQAQDVTERARMEEVKRRAYDRIEKNIEQFAVLGDHIRHPLQVILSMAELIEDERAERITEEVRKINAVMRDLDNGWVESRKVREFLRRNEDAQN